MKLEFQGSAFIAPTKAIVHFSLKNRIKVVEVTLNYELSPSSSGSSPQQVVESSDFSLASTQKRKAEEGEPNKDLKKAKLETKALKAKRPGFTDDRYNETSYYIENGLRKVYPYYFTFTTFTKGRWVGEKILDVFAREFRAHPAEEYERCIKGGTLTVNYEKVDVDYKLKHNDLLANIVHRHEVPVTAEPISIVHMDGDVVVVNKPASIPLEAALAAGRRVARGARDGAREKRHETPVLAKRIRLVHVDEDIVALDKPCSVPVHPCGRYRHNTVVFILAKEYNLKNLRTIHRLDRLTSGLLLFGRSPKKARQMEHQIRNRQVAKEYVCRVEGDFPEEEITCTEPIEVVSYKIGVCKVSSRGKECATTFQKLGFNPRTNTSVVLCKPHTGRMHQIRVHLQFLGFPVVNDPLYNHVVFGPHKGKGGLIGKADDELIRDLVNIHNAENWLGMDGDSDLSMFKPLARELDEDKGDDDDGDVSREPSPCGSCEDNTAPSCLGLHHNNNNNSSTHNNNNNNTASSGSGVTVAAMSSFVAHNSSGGSGSNNNNNKVTVATQTGHESPDLAFQQDKMTHDPHCYECKVRYRDPKPRDLIMYLHAWKFRGPDWSYETDLPEWSRVDWCEPDD